MNKKLLLIKAIILFTEASISYANGLPPFHGFYANLGLGYLATNIQDNIRTNAMVVAGGSVPVNDMVDQKLKTFTTGFNGGIGLGYSKPLQQHFVLGIEGRVNFENLDARFNTSYTTLSPTDLPPSYHLLPTTASVKLSRDYALLPKLGVLLQPKTLIYGLIGPAWGQFRVASATSFDLSANNGGGGLVTAHGDTSFALSSCKRGYQAAIGMEQVLTEGLSLALEYVYADYGKLAFPEQLTTSLNIVNFPVDSTLLSLNNSFRAQTNNATLRLAYYFG